MTILNDIFFGYIKTHHKVQKMNQKELLKVIYRQIYRINNPNITKRGIRNSKRLKKWCEKRLKKLRK